MKTITNKKANGIVYTPDWIVSQILDNLKYAADIETKKIIDPACGDGAFLTAVLDRFIMSAKENKKSSEEIKTLVENNLFGWDIDENAIKKCKIKLDLVAKEFGLENTTWNLSVTDSLNKNFCKNYFDYFDFVVGNPPYIRIQNLEKEKRNYIQKEWSLCKSGSTDIYLAFFELGYFLLKPEGYLGFITPNTYLKTSAGKDLRLFIKQKNILDTLIDFEHHQIFDNATTYVLITILNKNHQEKYFKLYKGNSNKEIEFIDNIDLKNLNDENWILASNKILEKVNTIEKKGIPLSRIAEIHVGITTLADDYYIFKNPIIKDKTAIINLKNGRKFEIERNILKPIVKASVLKSHDEEQNRFIIFPYKKVKGKHQIIPEDELKSKYPLTYGYFTQIKDILLARDKGKPNPVCWYAFGRSQGLETSFGKKILTSPINLRPKFIVWGKEDYTFYAGYCIKYPDNLDWLADILNSYDMEFYIKTISRNYQNNYKSFAKSFIQNFSIEIKDNIHFKKSNQQILLNFN
ncbi:MAG: hypothetical protein CVT88_05840 [Candidatus Altiarchaeales archaeon HGW-Altiarchaeales-1]|nr:MAG: hypothetical protein CVT88_05840 [Candidatus Altiarchaeales archaeon HGW-Altiarchaeales-1]